MSNACPVVFQSDERGRNERIWNETGASGSSFVWPAYDELLLPVNMVSIKDWKWFETRWTAVPLTVFSNSNRTTTKLLRIRHQRKQIPVESIAVSYILKLDCLAKAVDSVNFCLGDTMPIYLIFTSSEEQYHIAHIDNGIFWGRRLLKDMSYILSFIVYRLVGWAAPVLNWHANFNVTVKTDHFDKEGNKKCLK